MISNAWGDRNSFRFIFGYKKQMTRIDLCNKLRKSIFISIITVFKNKFHMSVNYNAPLFVEEY